MTSESKRDSVMTSVRRSLDVVEDPRLTDGIGELEDFLEQNFSSS